MKNLRFPIFPDISKFSDYRNFEDCNHLYLTQYQKEDNTESKTNKKY